MLIVLGPAVAAGLAAAAVPGGAVMTAEKMERRVTRSYTLQYLACLPQGYDPKSRRKWPLLIFLHGAGERGGDVQRVKIHGPIKEVESGRSLPFVIIAPLCPADSWWDQELEALSVLLDIVLRSYRVDERQVYLTGLSMGGFGTWAWACREPQRFAAVAPICGGGNPWLAWRMRDVPVWAFHGARDEVVPLSATQTMVDALKDKAGAKEVKLTVYPEAAHDSWSAAYSDPALYEWLLSHSLPAAGGAK